MKYFRDFIPTEEGLDRIAEVLLSDDSYLSDERRTPLGVWGLLTHLFSGVSGTVAYESDGGVLIFRDVVPNYRTTVDIFVFDKSKWGPGLLKEGIGIIRNVMELYNLRKVEADTTTKKWAHFLLKQGFVMEGVREDGFIKNGELVPLYLLGYRRAV